MSRVITYAEAICEATDQCLAADANVYVMGLGVPDPKGVFGTTLGLKERHGARVMDMPTSENAMTGVAIGAAIVGMRPILTHQRLDFALLSIEQLVNQAAKFHYMFGGEASVPLVVRMVIGRGWGQGPQHSQSLQAWFAHVPGLKVVMPATAYDAKGLLIAAVEDDNPVIYLEHRWLHGTKGEVPEEPYRVPIGEARRLREGEDITLVGISYMTIEAMRAAEVLAGHGISAEVIDLRSLRPFDADTVIASVRRTGRLLVADTGGVTGGFGGEIVSQIVERAFDRLICPPRRIGLPDVPTPTSPALARHYYPRAGDIVTAVMEMLARGPVAMPPADGPLDVPDPGFTGPF